MHERFKYFELAHSQNNMFIRQIACDESEIARFCKKWGNKSLFISAYRYSNADKSGDIYAPYFYIDIDDKNLSSDNKDDAENAWRRIRREFLYICSILDVYYGIKKEYIFTYFSGKKGLTLLIPAAAFGLNASENLNETMGLIIEDITTCIPYANLTLVDKKIYDRSRLLRMPNTIHEDTGLYKIMLTHSEVLNNSFEKIKEMAQKPRSIEIIEKAPVSAKAVGRIRYILEQAALKAAKSGGKNGKLQYEPPCVKAALENGAEAGTRNNTLAALADYYKQRGLDYEEVVSTLLDWNSQKCAPPLRGAEVVATVRSIYKHNYKYGCRTFRQLGLCQMEGCKIGDRAAISMDGAGSTGFRRNPVNYRAWKDWIKHGV